MGDSSDVSSTDDSSSEEEAPLPPQPASPLFRGPPQKYCDCTRCVGQVVQKSYVCAQHIEKYGHHVRDVGASSSYMVSYEIQIYVHIFTLYFFF